MNNVAVYGTVRCDDCTQDITKSIQIYPKEGGVLCEQCNFRKHDEEDREKE